jgi:hypothetical protein
MPDGLQYALQADLVYQSDLIGEVVVPSGFISDLASIPKALWSTLPPFGRYSAAAILHDHLFWSQQTSMQSANSVLREAMVLLGCDDVVVHAIFAAVSLFGSPAWEKNKALRASGYTRMSKGGDFPPYAGVPT